ncbi:MAG: hypothetical protein KC416_12115 [Myxococcales bacterium]|nr:hypothetical protein [Myxococcales bacterium]
MTRTTFFLALAALAIPLVGIGGCTEEVDNALDCSGICERYADCFDDNYDVDGCYDRCTDEANDNEDFEQKADTCAACIEGQSCVEGAFECGTQCAGVVP